MTAERGSYGVLNVAVEVSPNALTKHENPDRKVDAEASVRSSAIRWLGGFHVAGGWWDWVHWREAYGIFFLTRHHSLLGDLSPLPFLPTSLHLYPPVGENHLQYLSKASARLDLSCSRTLRVPLDPDTEVRIVPDLRGPPTSEEPLGACMTDGCGLVSIEVMEKLSAAKGIHRREMPHAVQVRYKGCKGMLMVDLEGRLLEPGKKVHFTESMCKYRTEEDDVPGVMEVVMFAQDTDGRLNQEFVTVLEAGGVTKEVLWERWVEYVNTFRALCFPPNPEETEPLINFLARDIPSDPLTGHRLPSLDFVEEQLCQKAETLRGVLLQHFTYEEPHVNAMLRDYLASHNRLVRERATVPIVESRRMVILPDWTGSLEEGECYFELPQPVGRFLDGQYVLALKNPARLPSDCQKLKFKYVEALRFHTKVCFLSVKGNVREADRISGGDYDGDVALLIWDEGIVNSFTKPTRNVPPVFGAVKDAFAKSDLTVVSVTLIGKYALYHAAATEKFGLDYGDTLYYAQMFAKLMDARKQGEVIKASKLEEDRKHFENLRIGGSGDLRKPLPQGLNVPQVPVHTKFLWALITNKEEEPGGLPTFVGFDRDIISYLEGEAEERDEKFRSDFKCIDSVVREVQSLWNNYWQQEKSGVPRHVPWDKPKGEACRDIVPPPPGVSYEELVVHLRRPLDQHPQERYLQSPCFREEAGIDRLTKLKGAILYRISSNDDYMMQPKKFAFVLVSDYLGNIKATKVARKTVVSPRQSPAREQPG
ncbi:hypothetical protein HDU93_003539 [Gonapodya sp. JEL0774]|nr:hypothetical protein HDU93_003539 [Gonapodya sp. JEL0774]